MAEFSKGKYAGEVALLSLTTLMQVATFIVSGFAASNDPNKFGFENSTGEVSDKYFTQVSLSFSEVLRYSGSDAVTLLVIK